MLNEVAGDLFDSTESLVHCVSRDLRMGKGIACVFKSKFGGIDELKKQGAGDGGMAVLTRGNRFVYYLITKECYYHKPTLATLKDSLTAAKAHCLQHNVTRLSMPRIGCGLDGLNWSDVSRLIQDVFVDTNIAVTVYVK